MHVLLTGGCGYIGTVLTSKLLNMEIDVTVVDIIFSIVEVICHVGYMKTERIQSMEMHRSRISNKQP
ncbi:MAG: hypothetical protein HQK61_12150 [Desulfamplus sp.]|nr:hypothetical protein [Desulfamplus sp.]